jgi:hypothetical protein
VYIVAAPVICGYLMVGWLSKELDMRCVYCASYIIKTGFVLELSYDLFELCCGWNVYISIPEFICRGECIYNKIRVLDNGASTNSVKSAYMLWSISGC